MAAFVSAAEREGAHAVARRRRVGRLVVRAGAGVVLVQVLARARGLNELLRGELTLADDEHRARSLTHDGLGDAAHDEASEALAPVGSDHDEIGVHRASDLGEHGRGRTDDGASLHDVGVAALLQVLLEALEPSFATSLRSAGMGLSISSCGTTWTA
jgi:hypothetical protein